MIITYQGAEFFKVQYGDTTIAFNPISKDSKLKGARFGADIAFVSLNHKDMNGVANLEFGEKKPFTVSGPGEYEIKGIFARGFASESNYDGEKRINTIYLVSIENINICFLGSFGGKELGSEIEEALDAIDILFVPIGGDGVLGPSEAYKLAVKLEPKIIIPMHYGEIGGKSVLETFLKEGGAEKAESFEKLTLKRKDLEGKEGEIVVLSAQA